MYPNEFIEEISLGCPVCNVCMLLKLCYLFAAVMWKEIQASFFSGSFESSKCSKTDDLIFSSD